MSNDKEVSDFAAFYRMYKQLESENKRAESIQPLAGPQHHTTEAHRPPAQRPSPARVRPLLYRQPPLQNAPEILTFYRALHEVKRMLQNIHAVLNNVQNMSEQIKMTVEENMAIMNGNMERFEVIGRGVLNLALQSSASQPPDGSSSQSQTSTNPPPLNPHTSQQQTSSNTQKPHGHGPNVTQPPAAFMPSSNTIQPVYALAPSQVPESYSDPNYVDYTGFDFLANDTS